MRKIAEIKKDLSGKIAEAKAIENTAENAETLRGILGDIESLQGELNGANAVEAAERALAEEHFDHEARKGHSFSFVKFMREAARGEFTGIERDAADAGRDEYRRLGLTQQGHVIPSSILRSAAGQNYSTNADGGYAITEMPQRYMEQLRDKLVMSSLGATILGDLVGTLPVIKATDITAAWDAEGDTGSISKSTFSKLTMTPHRSVVAGAITKDLLRQTSLDVERIIREKLMHAHAALLDGAAITGTGSNDQPTGILATSGIGSVAGGTNGAAISWANLVKLETVVNSNNGNRGKLAYLTNAKVIGAMKTIERASNTARFILNDDGTANGYKVEWTNLVPSNLTKGTSSQVCSAMIFGNFEDLWIGQWGGLDLVVDPFTLALNADVRFVLNAWNDVKVVEPKSFAAIQDITIA